MSSMNGSTKAASVPAGLAMVIVSVALPPGSIPVAGWIVCVITGLPPATVNAAPAAGVLPAAVTSGEAVTA